MRDDRLVLLSMGGLPDVARSSWTAAGVSDFVSLRAPAPSGRRFGSLALGLGLDAMRVAVRGRLMHRKVVFVCGSPWIALALRLLGTREFWTIGVYSRPNSRSWQVLRWAIRDNPVICTLQSEADTWSASGGSARYVRYGNTFGYPASAPRSEASRIEVFIGGQSDRDARLLEDLVEEVLTSRFAMDLIIADGSGPRRLRSERSNVEWLPYVTQETFGRCLSRSDVVFLPLQDNSRSAGHMVAVGALESGVRVVCSDTSAMNGYIDGRFVSALTSKDRSSSEAVLERLVEMVSADSVASRPAAEEIREYWRTYFSLNAFASMAISTLSEIWEQKCRL